jgi:PAS domain S-box-containing protein
MLANADGERTPLAAGICGNCGASGDPGDHNFVPYRTNADSFSVYRWPQALQFSETRRMPNKKSGLVPYFVSQNITVNAIVCVSPCILIGILWFSNILPKWIAPGEVIISIVLIEALIVRFILLKTCYNINTIATLINATQDGDYKIRGSLRVSSPFNSLVSSLNELADTLQERRAKEEQALSLAHKLMSSLESAVFVFDHQHNLVICNEVAARLFGGTSEELISRTAESLGIEALLQNQANKVVEHRFPASAGRWELHHSSFRIRGHLGRVLVLHDITKALRATEREAWQSLIRVLGHEVNNSLGGISSISEALLSSMQKTPLPDDWKEDLENALRIIARRSSGLSGFLAGYTALAKLPKPTLKPVQLTDMLERAIRMESRAKIELVADESFTVSVDLDQIEQALINLIQNAVDAIAPLTSGVLIHCSRMGSYASVDIDDVGVGLPQSGNLFTPFFTTKPDGSGIGLVLSRQIAEAHGGSLELMPNPAGRGTRARLTLPLHIERV